ncbi:hypothetical protein [Comamonas sp. GB3 AK4-5]|uniref:hypothetical protein n=1 Tax=Comamonas sp. GB3 AK4-5 TaxID=3231487 RepID=UPI00351E0FC7
MFVLCLLGLLCTATLAFWPLNPQAPNPARAAALVLLMLGGALTSLLLTIAAGWSSWQGSSAPWRSSLLLAVLSSACAIARRRWPPGISSCVAPCTRPCAGPGIHRPATLKKKSTLSA